MAEPLDRVSHEMLASNPAPPSNLANSMISHGRGNLAEPAGNRSSTENETTFGKSASIFINEPIGSMSLSPANRDVVLAARKGLYIVDLESPYAPPRFLAQLSSWEAADVQWSPHPARSHWVASTSNDRLLIWNLERPEGAFRGPPPFMAGRNLGAGSGAIDALQSKLMRQSEQSLVSSNISGDLGPSLSSSMSGSALPTNHESWHSSARSSAIEYVLQAHTRAITDINFSAHHPDILASCGIDAWSWVWDLRTPQKPVQGYSAWNAPATQIKWNRSSPHRLATSVTNKVLVWDERKGALPLATIEAHENQIYGLDWSRDTSTAGLNKLVTCSLDGAVKFWDLGAPASQNAIGSRALITEPEQVIQTPTPIWRARHLPFGNGVMTLPQRGDLTLSMWSKESPEGGPVERFVGHKDVVKEYLFRTRGGQDTGKDDRRFQLITWSKDQTLRLWPVSAEAMVRVGHKPGAPIKVLQTRKDAKNISYRDPPSLSAASVPVDDAVVEGVAADDTSLRRPSILPSDSMQGVLVNNGSNVPRISCAKGAESPTSARRGNESLFGVTPRSNMLSASLSQGGSMLGTSPAAVNTDGTMSRSYSKSLSKSLQAKAESSGRSNNMAYSAERVTLRQRAGFLPPTGARPRMGTSSHHASMATPLSSIGRKEGAAVTHSLQSADSGKLVQFADKHKASCRRKTEQKRQKRLAHGAALTYMTRGSGIATGSDLLRNSTRLGAFQSQKGRGRNDAVSWISGVRVERDQRTSTKHPGPNINSSSQGPDNPLHKDTASTKYLQGTQRPLALATLGQGDPPHQDSQVRKHPEHHDEHDLQKEIMDVARSAPQVTFEKVDIAKRRCTLSLYGPWAHHGETVFLRLSLQFPKNYPARAPRHDLEHNASVFLKTRAFLLKSLSTILDECAHQSEGCIMPCTSFLSGASTIELREGLVLASQGVKTFEDTDEEDENQEQHEFAVSDRNAVTSKETFTRRQSHTGQMIRILPGPRCGASWGPTGQLVVFRVADGGVSSGFASRDASHPPSRPSSALGALPPPALALTSSVGTGTNARPAPSNASVATSQAGAGTSSLKDGHLRSSHGDKGRFLRSYAELTKAMASLARMADAHPEGESLRDSSEAKVDVTVSPMKVANGHNAEPLAFMSTEFLARRLQARSDSRNLGKADSPRGMGTGVTRSKKVEGLEAREERGAARIPPSPIVSAAAHTDERVGRARSSNSAAAAVAGMRSRSVVVGSGRRDRARHLGLSSVMSPPFAAPSTTLIRGHYSEVKLFQFDEVDLTLRMLHEEPQKVIEQVPRAGTKQELAGGRTNGDVAANEPISSASRPGFWRKRSESSPVAAERRRWPDV
ncbi:unnamed protein product [Parajaminaea phylloscopi]